MIMGKSIPEAEKLFSHILNAQHIWVCRINDIVPKFKIFDPHPLSDFAYFQDQCALGLTAILAERDLSEKVAYSNSKGEEFTDTVGDILFHVINHSTYHRGQIASLLRLNNIQPPITDYIVLRREGEL
jgi:uncharacterized damage-inducible protein DinB